MDIYKINSIGNLLEGNTYPGRGIIVGKSADGENAIAAYFIMGRSANSRNRVFVERDGAVFTEAFDPSKLEDPSLIIYAALRDYENKLIVTNGDQTDTVYEGLQAGKTFHSSLTVREFEPDGPNFTPRISAMLEFAEDDFTYSMSILKSADAEGTACNRYGFDYPSLAGLGHFIHTYVCDGNPIPTFQGEPERVALGNNIDEVAEEIWNALNEDNKISLYVRFVNLKTKEVQNRMINKNK
ncbi:MAG: IMP cyclohydrolase [Lachnospiraceae bacterium]|nr:IMP cyclohydrolase [Lachnospiraceae bacterium]